MEVPLQILGSIAGLGMLICHIIVIVKMFQAGQTALGIVAIIGTCCCYGYLLTLIYGWMKVHEWNISMVMYIYTGCFIVSLISNGLNYHQIQTQIEQIQKR
jgi:hypothetical protein